MAEPIGYAPLQIIPSLEGVSKSMNTQLGFLPALGKKAGKDFGKNVTAGAEGEIKKLGDTYAKQYDRMKDAAGKLRTEEAKLQDLRDKGITGGRLVAQTEKLEKARRDEAKATREASSAYKDYDDAQKNVGQKTSLLSGAFDSLSGSLGVTKGNMAALAGGAVAAAGIAGLGALISVSVEVTKKLYEIGSAFDDVADTIAAKTGASGAALDSLTDSVDNIASTTPVGIGAIGDVVAEVSRNLHLTGTDLDVFGKQVVQLNRISGENTDLRAAGKAFRGFGLDAKQQSTALDQLYTASTRTGLGVNDLLASVVKGGPALRALGLDFGQSAALVSTFEDAGLDADKSMAGLTKGLANFAKNGKDAPKALGDTVTQIDKLIKSGDTAAAQDISNKLFGAKSGVAFFEAIKSGALDLSALSTAFDGTTLSINDVADSTNDAAEQWQIFKNKAEEAVKPLATSVFSVAGSGLADLGTWVDQHSDQIAQFFVKFALGSLDALDGVLQFSSGTIKALEPVIKAFAVVGEAIVGSFSETFRLLGIGIKFIPGMESIGRGMEQAGEAGGKMAQSFRLLPDAIDPLVGGIDAIRDKIPGLRDGILGLGGDAEGAGGKIGGLGNSILGLPSKKDVAINITDGQGHSISYAQFLGLPTNGQPAPVSAPGTPGGAPKNPLDVIAGRAGGGQVFGAGTGTSDSILARLSNKEFVVNADATQKNLPLLEAINSGKIPGFAGGGLVAGDEQLRKIIGERFGINNIGGYRPADKYGEHSTGRALDVMVGGDKGKGDAVKDFALSNAAAIDLKWVIWRQHLYYPGGGGYDMEDRGSPTQNHMDHVHIFSGTGITNGLRGALSGGGSATPLAVGGPGAEDTSASDQTGAAATSGTSSSGGGISLASSFSGLSSFGLDSLGSGVGTTKSGSDLSLFGKAAGSAVSGQVSSALGVFGIGDAPPFLQAASKLASGISIGGGSSSAPVSARPLMSSAALPDAPHGASAGQAPGPQTIYNIRTATVEDAFLQAQRRQDVRTAAKLDRY